MFTSTNVLAESMMVNLTTVYYSLLKYDEIAVQIPSMLILLTFLSSSSEWVMPGYENSALHRRLSSNFQKRLRMILESKLVRRLLV